MRLYLLTLLLSGSLVQKIAAQVAPAPKDIVATRYQLPGADCALFPAEAELPYWVVKQPLRQRFTPIPLQIADTEKALLKVRLLRIRPSEKTRHQAAYAAQIKKKLGEYRRQYYGFYDTNGQPCLYINLVLNSAYSSDWLYTPVHPIDTGAGYWSVYYNLTTQTFYNFSHDTAGD